jgi:hypothetical protein
MSRSGVFYVVKAMERAAAGTTTASPSRIPHGWADHDAPETIRAHGDSPSRVWRVFAALSRSIGRAPGRTGHRRLGRAVRAD